MSLVNKLRARRAGEWRSVPGFSSEQLRVSEHGYARVFRGRGGWALPHAAARKSRKRNCAASHHSKWQWILVYQLVCRAWKGPQPAGTTCDHNDQNSDNNNASNLSWATRSEQRRNQREGRKHRRQGKAVRVRNKEWPVGVWKTFESTLAASEYYELDVGNLSKVLNGKCTNHHGFLAEYVEDAESQVPLEAGDDSNLPIPPLDPAPSGIPEAGPRRQGRCGNRRSVWKTYGFRTGGVFNQGTNVAEDGDACTHPSQTPVPTTRQSKASTFTFLCLRRSKAEGAR